MLGRLFASATVAHAHCDLYCGVYDPAQAKIEAMSVLKIAKIPGLRRRGVPRPLHPDQEQRAERPNTTSWCCGRLLRSRALRAVPQPARAVLEGHPPGRRGQEVDGSGRRPKLIDYIDEIADIFWQTDKAKQMGVYPPA